MEVLQNLYTQVREFLNIYLFKLGPVSFTLWTLLYLIVLLVLLIVVSRLLKRWLIKSVFSRKGVEVGVGQAVATIVQYVLVFIGFLVILSTAGIDLTALNVLAGAIGIGVGFGLQGIANNFISGLIILFERPIKVGDRIQVGDVTGDVARIGGRATTVRTNDNISMIIPNSEFISTRVVNWSHSDRDIRLNVPVGVSYKSDVEEVRDILLEVARSHNAVLTSPPPDVIFDGFGDSSLNFTLRVWTREFIARPQILKSDLYFAIRKMFQKHGVEIPFPQRDLHIRTGGADLDAQQQSANPESSNK